MENLLKTEINNGIVIISIGLEELAFAVDHGPQWPDEYRVDPEEGTYKEFGKSFLQYLNHEEEDGTTPIHRMFDSVADEALNQGAEGFIDNDTI